MNNRLKQIGFSQRIHLEWFEYTAGLVLAGKTKNEIRLELNDFLQDKLSTDGMAKRNSREKTISILMKCWVDVPKELKSFREDGLNILRNLSSDNHLAMHWGIVMAVYPFWGIVAETAGRLLRLQGTVAASQVQRRVRELLGERETVSRATRRVLRTFIDWRVLEETEKKGIYKQKNIKNLTDIRLIVWLIEAVLISKSSSQLSLKTIINNPSIFPFNMDLPNSKILEESVRMEIYQHGFDKRMIRLKRPMSLPLV
jgi:hypothetical protein